MKLEKHFDKNNLHHAYLIEGKRNEVLPVILEFVKKELGVDSQANPDCVQVSLDSFKIEDARNLKSYSAEKGFTTLKKIFIISANSFLLEAQHSLLKMFEEPIENTHFFLIVPDINSLLKTFVSRFYIIKDKTISETGDAERFIKMSLKDRIEFVKELLPKKDEESEVDVYTESNSSKALKFLNALEFLLYQKLSKTVFGNGMFDHFFKVREFLRMPGASARTLMESVALIVPEKI